MGRGQAALEFLVSYGWAVLIILVMVGAIAYFGVFNPKDIAPDRCIIGDGFGCSDYQLSKWDNTQSMSEVLIGLQNNMGQTIEISEKLHIWCPEGCTSGYDTGNSQCGGLRADPYEVHNGVTAGTFPYSLSAGEVVYVRCNYGTGRSIEFKESGVKGKIYFTFNYTIQGGFKHRVDGELIADIIDQ